MDRAFQVDLRGVVDLLSHHLYSSPRVYVRELLQNSVDAITARRAADPGAPADVLVEAASGGIRVHDSGIGLTEDEVHDLLATVGRSSKRDAIGLARHEFLGQFGIGLLSAFLVADEVSVETRSATGGPTIRWTGYSDGRYRVERADAERADPGTSVTLRPRPGAEQWLSPRTVIELARLYGSLLPVRLSVNGSPVTGEGPPWLGSYSSPARRRDALSAYCRELFGFAPFATIDLAVPEAGLTGVAFVLPTSANPTVRAAHRVYLKRMLLAEGVEQLLPEWGFFVRCVVDAAELHPTANRESLFEDDLLDFTRHSLGTHVTEWLVGLGQTAPERLHEFLALHHLGVKALAVHDDDMLRTVDRWLEFETSDGPMPLAEFRRRHPLTRFTPNVDEFRRLAAVAGAQGIGLVNGGYVYDDEIISRLPRIDPDARLSRLDPAELTMSFGVVDPDAELGLRPFISAAQRAVDRLGCEVVVRDFDPPSLPALYLSSRAAEHQIELLEAQQRADPLWAEVLGAMEKAVTLDRPQLVLNHRSPLTRKISRIADPELVELAVQALYGQALLLGRYPLRAADTAILNRSFLGLLGWAVPEPDGRPE
jgi:molecular chaperone HtpG